MSGPLYLTGDRISWKVTADGDYVVLELPEQNQELLFDPVTAMELGDAMKRAGMDVIRDAWGGSGA